MPMRRLQHQPTPSQPRQVYHKKGLGDLKDRRWKPEGICKEDSRGAMTRPLCLCGEKTIIK